MSGPLEIDDDALAACVQCGLCLPHCPTWRVTGEEARSPRGRIDAMRDVQWHGADLDGGFAEVIESCVGCRACTTACPSGVDYGTLLAGATAGLTAPGGPGRVPWWQRTALALLDRRGAVRAAVVLGALAQRLGAGGRGPFANLPLLPVRQPPLRSTGADVVLLTGCVMDAAQRSVHAAAVEVLGRAGVGVWIQPAPGCCGALAEHRGLHDLGARQLARLAEGLPPGLPVLSDAAGCGAAIVEAGARPGAPDAVADLGARTREVTAFLAEHADRLPPPGDGPRERVVVAPPCHLRNVWGPSAAEAGRELLGRYCEVVATDDDDLCCGAGGAFSVLRPTDAAAIRSRKVAALRRSGAAVVVSANPGCALHLAAGGMLVEHPVQVLERLTRQEGADHGR